MWGKRCREVRGEAERRSRTGSRTRSGRGLCRPPGPRRGQLPARASRRPVAVTSASPGHGCPGAGGDRRLLAAAVPPLPSACVGAGERQPAPRRCLIPRQPCLKREAGREWDRLQLLWHFTPKPAIQKEMQNTPSLQGCHYWAKASEPGGSRKGRQRRDRKHFPASVTWRLGDHSFQCDLLATQSRWNGWKKGA